MSNSIDSSPSNVDSSLNSELPSYLSRISSFPPLILLSDPINFSFSFSSSKFPEFSSFLRSIGCEINSNNSSADEFHLSYFDSIFLIIHGRATSSFLSLSEIFLHCCSRCPRFPLLYSAFHRLSLDYSFLIRSGSKFGCDFLLYLDEFSHSKFATQIFAASTNSENSKNSNSSVLLSNFHRLSASTRICLGAHKEFLPIFVKFPSLNFPLHGSDDEIRSFLSVTEISMAKIERKFLTKLRNHTTATENEQRKKSKISKNSIENNETENNSSSAI